MNRAWIVAVALIIASRAWGESAYPEPPVAKQMFAITDQAIAQAQATSNPLSNFLRTSQGRYTLFPTATLIPPAAGRCNGRLRRLPLPKNTSPHGAKAADGFGRWIA
jgi:hypothetical protein